MGYNPTYKEFIVWSLGEMDEPIVVVGLGITDVGHGIPEWGIPTQPGVGTGGIWGIIIFVIIDLMPL